MILVGTNDFGPARYLYELVKKRNDIVWVDNPSLRTFFLKNNVHCKKKWEKTENIRLVLTGTCLQDGLDKKLIKWAINNKIPSVSIIDHWTLFNERFKLKNKKIFPNYIILNDRYAYKLAVKDNLPKERLFIGGNPIIQKLLANGKVKFNSKERSNKNKKVLFISESLNYFKKGTKIYKGYNEYEVLKILINSLPKYSSITIKKHPSERKEKYKSYFTKYNIKETKISDVNKLAKKYDFFIGMESMMLIQLSFLSQNVISLRPNARHEFFGSKIGLIKDINSSNELVKIFKSNIENKQKEKYLEIKKDYLFSKKRINNFLNKILK